MWVSGRWSPKAESARHGSQRHARAGRGTAMPGLNLRPWSQGDDNGLCGLFATINAIRWLWPDWLWPELRQKNEQDEEQVADLPRHLVQDRLSAEQFQALCLDGDE